MVSAGYIRSDLFEPSKCVTPTFEDNVKEETECKNHLLVCLQSPVTAHHQTANHRLNMVSIKVAPSTEPYRGFHLKNEVAIAGPIAVFVGKNGAGKSRFFDSVQAAVTCPQ